MKMKNYLMSALVFGTLVLLASCDKKVENTDLQVDLARKAPVKAYVYAQLDRTTAGFEFAPEGTKVVLSVAYGDFGTASAGKWLDTVKVNASGFIEAMVPVDDNGVTVNIEPIVFEAEQVRSYGSNSDKVLMIYQAPNKTVALSTSNNAVEQIFYAATQVASFVDFAPVTFKIVAETDNSLTGNEPVANQQVVLYNADWKQTYTTDNNGQFTASVPAGVAISIDIEFVFGKKVPDAGSFVAKNYKYKKTGEIGTWASKSDATIDLGAGEEVK